MNGTTCTHAVALEDLRTVLVAHQLRRRAAGRLAPLAVTTPAPMLEVDCSSAGQRHLQTMRETAQRIGHWKSRVGPLQRGHIARLFDRVQCVGRSREVQRTWHTGIGQLRREPRYTLHLPLLCQVQP
jgi:hypothetical protein